MNMLRGLFWVTTVSVLLAGCSARGGFLRDAFTVVEISERPFQIVKTDLSASTQTGRLFCAIELKPVNQYQELMRSLHEQADLGPNQALVNIREDHRRKAYLGLFCSYRITLSADVIEFQ